MRKSIFILITILVSQPLFSAIKKQDLPVHIIQKSNECPSEQKKLEVSSHVKERQKAISKLEIRKKIEKEAMDRTAMIQNAKLQREIQLKNETMEQHDKIIEWKNEKEKSRYVDMVSTIMDKITISTNDKSQFESDPYRQSGNRCLDVYINNEESLTEYQGTDLTLTVHFCEGSSEALLQIGIDENGDNDWSQEDDIVLNATGMNDELMMSLLLSDNGEMDENPENGIFEFSFSTEFWDGEGEDLFFPVDFFTIFQYWRGFFVITDSLGNEDYVYYEQLPEQTGYSVSGSTSPETSNLIFYAFCENDNNIWALITTNKEGEYTVYYPPEPDELCLIGTLPLFEHTMGIFTDPTYYFFNLDGDLTGYDFTISLGDAFIEGYVSDQYNDPAEGVELYVIGWLDDEHNNDAPPLQTLTNTDSEGYYNVPVIGGMNWELQPINSENYMENWDNQQTVWVESGQTIMAEEILVYATDSFISGTVFLDGIPLTDTYNLEVRASSNDIGENETNVLEDGTYELPVASEADNINNGYQIYLNYWNGNNNNLGLPENVYLEEEYYNNIQSGSTDIDFYFISIDGGIEGYITDDSGNPLDDIEVSAHGYTLDNKYYSFWAESNSEGYYKLYLPPGWYDINIYPGYDSGVFYCSVSFNDIEIQDVLINQDFTLSVFTSDNKITGHVYDFETGLPISGMDVNLNFYGNDDCNLNVYIDTDTDEDGYYEFVNIPSMINGGYIDVDGYGDYLWYNVSIYGNHEGETVYDFTLFSTPSTITGSVLDSETLLPIYRSTICAIPEDSLMSSLYGSICDGIYGNENYKIDLPNGCYTLRAYYSYHGGDNSLPYLDTYIYDVCIYNEEFIQDIYLEPFPIGGFVSGYVNEGNGEAVPNATVYAYGWIQTDTLMNYNNIYWNFETLTDSSGYYMIGFPNGEYGGLSASKEGYLSDWNNENIIIDNNSYENMNFTLLELTSSISGNVYDADTDEQLYDVWVYVHEMDENGNYNNYIASDWVYEYDNGSYNLALPDGCFQVRFSKNSSGELPYLESTHDFCVTAEDYEYDAYLIVDDCVGEYDECGVCGGEGIADGACDCDGNVDAGCGCGAAGPSGCDNACNSTAVVDCAGDCGGDAVLSGCDNVCNSTAEVDCAGVCDGDAVVDCAGVCEGTTTQEYCNACTSGVFDCAGECGGKAEEDHCGVCSDGPPANECITTDNTALYGAWNFTVTDCAGDTIDTGTDAYLSGGYIVLNADSSHQTVFSTTLSTGDCTTDSDCVSDDELEVMCNINTGDCDFNLDPCLEVDIGEVDENGMVFSECTTRWGYIEDPEEFCWGMNLDVSLPVGTELSDGTVLTEEMLVAEDLFWGFCSDITITNGVLSSLTLNMDDNNECFILTITGEHVLGCTDPNSCNYDPNANTNDGSCTYIAETDCDCDGNVEDCAGECGDSAVLDECGVCGGNGYTDWACNDGVSTCWNIVEGACDCDGNVLDECEVCGGDGLAEGFDCDGNQLSLFNGLIPEEYNLHSIYPNPFNPATNIIYGLPKYSKVHIIIYNISGQPVITLVNKYQTPGYYSTGWNADGYPSGIYFVNIIAGEYVNTQKLMLVK